MSLSISKNKIKLELDYTHQWSCNPINLQILVDDRTIHVDLSGKNSVNFKKLVSLADGDHLLKLVVSNKGDPQSFIKINKLVIDGANMAQLMQSDSIFYGKSSKLTNPGGLYEDGEWQFAFKLPMLQWLLKKLS
jgi:hypothetical protein